MTYRLTMMLSASLFLLFGCSSPTTEEPITPWSGEKCVPGTLRGCDCSDGSGIEKCDLNGQWTTCDCSSDIVIDPDTILAGDAKSVSPNQANMPSTVSPVSGVGRLKSENYELQIIIGPTSPVSSAESENYGVQLGPIGVRSE